MTFAFLHRAEAILAFLRDRFPGDPEVERAIADMALHDQELEDYLSALDTSGDAAVVLSTRIERTTDLPVANITDTPIPFQTAVWDDLDAWDSGSPQRLTLSQGGLYILTASAKYAANSDSTTRSFYIRRNSTSSGVVAEDTRPATAVLGNTTAGTLSVPVRVTAGDWFIVGTFQASGGNLNLLGSNVGAIHFSATRIGD